MALITNPKVGPRSDKIRVVLAEIFHCSETETNVAGTNTNISGTNVSKTVPTHAGGLNNQPSMLVHVWSKSDQFFKLHYYYSGWVGVGGGGGGGRNNQTYC